MFQSSSSASVYLQATGDDFYSALAMNGCLLLEDLRRSRCTGAEYSETALTGKASEWRLWRENMAVYLAELKLAFALHTRHAGPSKSIIR